MILKAVCIGTPQPTPAKSGVTGHFKQPVDHPVAIGALGLAGDHICDTDHHGGVDQAVYLFGTNDVTHWAGVYDRAIDAGFFGENLLVDGMASADICIGDRFTIGSTVLEVTSTRIPCATYQAHIGRKDALFEFMRAARAGAYARVITEGQVTAGDVVHHAPFDGPKITMVDAMYAYVDGFKDRAFCQKLLKTPAHHKMIAKARDMLSR